MKKESFIYGLHPVMEAILSGSEVERVLVRKGLKGDLAAELMDLLHERHILYQVVPVEKLNRTTPKNHQGVIAWITMVTFAKLGDIIPRVYESGQSPLILLLDGITDVRNFGAISRTAECAGVHAIVIPIRGAAQLNEESVRTSAGALLRIPVSRFSDLTDAVEFMHKSGICVVGASEKANRMYYEENFDAPLAIVIGSEEKGIPQDMMKKCDHLVRIPMLGEITSLNVSVAAGILLFEAVRQRRTGA